MDAVTATELYRELSEALDLAAKGEQALGQHHSDNRNVSINTGMHTRFQQIIGTELPETFGKLIGTLGLHRQFQLLGCYVRNFEDAVFVANKLKEPILHALEEVVTVPPIKPFAHLIFVSTEATRIVAVILADQPAGIYAV